MDAQREAALNRLRPYAERAAAFSGSRFDVSMRALGPPLPWSYEALVREAAQGRTSALDLGTGGGERLAALGTALPERTVATEEWATNAPLARARLAPLGARVVRCRSVRLPFGGARFDLVLSRHEELDPGEVARVLRPGGAIVTQQVGRDDWCELRAFFPRMLDPGDVNGAYAVGLRDAGFHVTRSARHDGRVAFGTLGDVLYMLVVSPWLIPDLSLEDDVDALLALERAHASADGLVLTESRTLLIATKPA